MHFKMIFCLLIALTMLLFFATTAFAWDYYTYGGFDPITQAFEGAAHIFADHNFRGSITTFALLGLFFAGASGFFKMASGQGGPLGWLVPFMFGTFLYLGLFVKTDQLAVFDPTLNQNKVIAGLPVGIVYTAGIINTLERFVIEVFDNNAPLPPTNACGQLSPMTYQQNGGAIGTQLLANSTSAIIQNSNASQSLTDYVENCVRFELNRPGTTLTLDNILNPPCGKTILDILGQAASPGNFTSTFLTGNPVGDMTTCSSAYTLLSNFYSDPNNASAASLKHSEFVTSMVSMAGGKENFGVKAPVQVMKETAQAVKSAVRPNSHEQAARPNSHKSGRPV